MFGIDDAIIGSVVGDVASAAIGGGLSFLGQSSANEANIANTKAINEANLQIARENNAFNASEAALNRDFQAQQRATAYQTAVKDMMAAGLNPMLAYSQGGASNVSGAQGIAQQVSMQAPRVENALAGLGHSISNVRPSESRLKGESAKVAIEQQAQIQANTALAAQQAKTSAAQEQDALAGVAVKNTQARLNTASEAAQRANAYKTTEEGKFVASQRAEVEAKSPLWNMFHSAAKKVKEVSESSAAANVKRAADNLRSLSGVPSNDTPRSITIYGNPK